MKEILAIDLGNFNIKTNKNVVFNSRYLVDTNVINRVGEEIVKFNGVEYFIGKGTFDKEYNKIKKDYLPNLLYAIGTSTKEEKIGLVLGLPVAQISQSEIFKQELEGKKFKFEINNKEHEVEIEKLAVVAEGLSSYYALPKESRKNDLTILDVGGRTVNVVTMVDNKVYDKKTLPYGVIDLYKDIITMINADGEKLTEEELDLKLKWGELDNYIDKINVLKLDFIKRVMNDLKEIKIAPERHFTGGGSVFLGDTIKKIKNSKVMVEPLFTNVIGNYNLGFSKWGAKEK